MVSSWLDLSSGTCQYPFDASNVLKYFAVLLTPLTASFGVKWVQRASNKTIQIGQIDANSEFPVVFWHNNERMSPVGGLSHCSDDPLAFHVVEHSLDFGTKCVRDWTNTIHRKWHSVRQQFNFQGRSGHWFQLAIALEDISKLFDELLFHCSDSVLIRGASQYTVDSWRRMGIRWWKNA